MKYLIILLLSPFILNAQNIIDPIPIINDTTAYYDLIEREQNKFILGWNWGTPGKKLDDALNINFYHDFPLFSNDEYANNVRISQQLGGNLIGGRPQNGIFNTQSLYLEPSINPTHPNSPVDFSLLLEIRTVQFLDL